jgi:exodeoxyribonuclease-5
MNTLTLSDLSPDQRVAYDGIKSWLNRGSLTKPTLRLAGYAGSGKSYIVSLLAKEMPRPLAFCAFTGKASSVLGRKLAQAGIATVNRTVRRVPGEGPVCEPRPYCGTIHGLIYRPCDVCMIEEEHEHTFGQGCKETSAVLGSADEDAALHVELTNADGETVPPIKFENDGPCLACNPPAPKKKTDGPCRKCNDARFLRRGQLDREYQLIVIDEASMVDEDMLRGLLAYGVPILAVGDHGQLPPVKGMSSLMVNPDLRLETIHRQAAGNPIIALSQRVREIGDIDDSFEDGDAFTILARRDLEKWIGSRYTSARLAADPRSAAGIMGVSLVCWTNRTRVALNYDVRGALFNEHDDAGPPRAGEVMICLKNAAPIYNGMRGVLLSDAQRAGDAGGRAPKWKITVDFVEDGQKADNVLVSEHQFFAEKTIDYETAQQLGVSMAKLGQLYDFGYAMTCHKMQGSQTPEVGVVLEPGMRDREMRTRWIYTAITRASDKLTVIR